MRTVLTKEEIYELKKAGFNDIRTLHDIFDTLPERLFQKYHLNISHEADSSWRVAYTAETGTRLMRVSGGDLIAALKRMLVDLAREAESLKASLTEQ